MRIAASPRTATPAARYARLSVARCIAIAVITAVGVPAFAGPLSPPPGPINSTPSPEPRTPLSPLNTPGDATCVFRIDAPGSYYLTGNLIATGGKSATINFS